MKPARSKEEMNLFQNKIVFFKAIACRIFGTYQSSQMRAQKWQALDHICIVSREMRNMTYHHGGLF